MILTCIVPEGVFQLLLHRIHKMIQVFPKILEECQKIFVAKSGRFVCLNYLNNRATKRLEKSKYSEVTCSLRNYLTCPA